MVPMTSQGFRAQLRSRSATPTRGTVPVGRSARAASPNLGEWLDGAGRILLTQRGLLRRSAGATPISRLRQSAASAGTRSGSSARPRTGRSPARCGAGAEEESRAPEVPAQGWFPRSRLCGDPRHSVRRPPDGRDHGRVRERISGFVMRTEGNPADAGLPFPHLAGSSPLRHGTCLAAQTPWLYSGFAVPDRTGGQIKGSAARSRYGLDPRRVCVPLAHTTQPRANRPTAT